MSDNLWPELAKWQAESPLLQQTFEWGKTRISCRESPETWFATARTWPRSADPQRQAETLAGIHADHVLFVLDESGSIPQAVMTTAEAVLARSNRGALPVHRKIDPIGKFVTIRAVS